MRAILRLAAGTVAIFAASSPALARAATPVPPAIAMEPANASVGEQVTIRGLSWPANGQVNVELCGNEARRSTPDCDQAGSTIGTADASGKLAVVMTLGTPPVPCPCVIRATGLDSQATVTLPVLVNGLPSGDPVVLGTVFPDVKRTLQVVSARLTGGDSLMQWLGAGPKRNLQLTIKNTGNVAISDPNLTAAVGKGANPTGMVQPKALGTLQPGEQKTISVPVGLGALSFGSYNVKGEVLGFEPRATFSASTSSYPWLLIAAALGALQLVLLKVRNRLRDRLWERTEQEELELESEPLALTVAVAAEIEPVHAGIEAAMVDIDLTTSENEEVMTLAMEAHESDRMASQLASAVVEALRGASPPRSSNGRAEEPEPEPAHVFEFEPEPVADLEFEFDPEPEPEPEPELLRAPLTPPLMRPIVPVGSVPERPHTAELGGLVHSLQQLAVDLVNASAKRVEEFERAAISVANGAAAARASVEGRSAVALEGAMTGFMDARRALDAVRDDAYAVVDEAHEQARRLITEAEHHALVIIEEARLRAADLAAEAQAASQVIDVTTPSPERELDAVAGGNVR